MALTERDLEQVGTYVQSHLYEWLPAPVLQLSERIIRVEEELKSQRDLMKQGFEQVERRFEHVERRFEQVERRFTGVMWLIGTGFVLLSTLMSLYTFLA
ncbi:MAG: hypothetical protein ACOC0O_02050 [Spirochaetota bacterium]